MHKQAPVYLPQCCISFCPGRLFMLPQYIFWGMKLITHLHLMPRSKNAWIIIPLPQHTFMAWCSVKKKKKSTWTTLPYNMYFTQNLWILIIFQNVTCLAIMVYQLLLSNKNKCVYKEAKMSLTHTHTSAIWEVCGLTLLLQVGTLWMCGDSLFRSTSLRLYGRCSNAVPPIHFFQAQHRIQFRSHPVEFLGFSNHEKRVLRQEILKWSIVCSMFSRSGWSIIRSALLANTGTSKKRPSPHLNKVLTRSNKVSPWTLRTALIYTHTKSYETEI